jgi:hypothetical protein
MTTITVLVFLVGAMLGGVGGVMAMSMMVLARACDEAEERSKEAMARRV